MRRLRSREDLAPVKVRLILALVMVAFAILLFYTGGIFGAIGLLCVAFVLVATAKRDP